jgi:hypothetical protein
MSQHLRIQSLETELRLVREERDAIQREYNGYQQEHALIVAERREESARIKKLVEAADYLQHCRRREIQATAFGYSTSAKRSVERASDTYDYLRGQVKL